MGSEMCIRDSVSLLARFFFETAPKALSYCNGSSIPDRAALEEDTGNVRQHTQDRPVIQTHSPIVNQQFVGIRRLE